jgi:hypothetical protein
VINASGGTQSIVFRGAGPTTGVTIVKGESAVVAWNGTDFIKISNAGGSASFTNVTVSGTTTLSGLTASTALALNASKEVVSVTNTGTGNNVLATSPTLVTPALGTPSSVTLTNATGLPISTGVSGLGTGVATALAVNVGTAGSPVVNGGVLGTPSSGTLTNATGLPVATGISGLGTGIATALAVNVGTAGAPVINGGVLGTPSSGTVTNLTGTASININGTVGATTATTGAFTTLTTSSTVTHNGGTANGVAFLDASKVLTTGSALTFDGTNLAIGASPTFYGGQVATAGSIAITGGNLLKLWNTGGTGVGGISSPGTDTLSFSVGSGFSEQMRLTSTGLGIGTSSPTQRLEVNGAGQFGTGNTTSSGALSLRVGVFNTVPSNATDAFVGVHNTDGSGLTAGDLVLMPRSSTGVNNNIVFLTGQTTPTIRATIDTSGNFGIGTSSPTSRLDVATTTQFNFDTTSTAGVRIGTQGTVGGSFMVQTPSLSASFGSGLAIDGTYSGGKSTINLKAFGVFSGGPYSSDLAFFTSSTTTLSEKMRLDSSGNLGLGVTPSAWTTYKAIQFSAQGSIASASNATYFGNNWFTDGTNKYIQSETAGLAGWEGNVFKWYQAPSGTAGNAISFTQAMTLDADGDLGIGTTSPTVKLNVAAANPTNGVLSLIQNISTSGQTGALVQLDVGNVGSSAVGIPGGTANALAFYVGGVTSGSERARIDSSGNLIQTVNTTAATLATNGTLTFSIVDNSTLRISVRGSDGTTRTATVALT